ncbi:MAG: NUDIX domain-containing protein [Bacteroidetes bacterium]|jgi:NADH pyrophosphatase NudC (nudix superfamily)|nr:NUDIX domain-containing protein [Bacteroidota bacterium]
MTPPPTYCPQCGTPLETQHDGERERPTCPSCGFVYYDNPDPVVAALVEHEGDVLLARNKGWPETWYGLVSGFLERGETPEAATLRELKEELGLDGEIVAMIGVYAFAEMHQLIVAYHVRATGTVRLGDELADYKRVPPDRLKPWPMGTGHAVRDWLRTHGYLDA